MTYDWSLYPNEIAITRNSHGMLFGNSRSRLEALEVLEQLIKCVKRRRTKIFDFQKYCLAESMDRQSDHSHC